MLQDLPSLVDSQRALPAEPGLAEMITAVYGMLRRQIAILICFLLLGIACGFLFLKIIPPVYTAQAEILFDRSHRPVVKQSVLEEGPFDASFFESQIKILQSERLASIVVAKLNLWEAPEFNGTSRDIFGTLRGYFVRLLQAPSPLPRSRSELEEHAVGAVLQKLDAKRSGTSFVVDISFKSKDPERAAQIANAVAEAYISDQMEAKRETIGRANEWLEVRLGELRRRASVDEYAVDSYKADNKIVDARGVLIGEQTLAELNSELVNARAKTSEALARLERIEAILQKDRLDESVDATVQDALNSPIITKLREEYLQLVNLESEYARRYGKDHTAVANIRSKIGYVSSSISSELRRIGETSRSEYLIAKKRQDNIEQILDAAVSQSQTTNRARVALRDLESAAQSSRSLHDLFQQRVLEMTQQQSLFFNDVRMIEPATVAAEKKSPKSIQILAFAAIGGAILGGGLAFLREMMDRVFRTSKQVEDILRVPCVALVPFEKEAPGKQNRNVLDQMSGSIPGGTRPVSAGPSVLQVVPSAPFSHFAEAIRSIKFAADLNGKRNPGGTIGMTSSLPNEGKSTLSVALAQVVAQAGRRVIVVDCDLRNPSLSRTLAPAARIGMLEVLSGKCSVSEVLYSDPATEMAFLPAVLNAELIDTAEILACDATEKLFGELRRSYDCIVLDLPPMLPVLDARATGHLVDCYFLVVEWGRTNIDLVQRALNTANSVYDKLAGVVLNKARMDYIGRYDPYYSKKEYFNSYFRENAG